MNNEDLLNEDPYLSRLRREYEQSKNFLSEARKRINQPELTAGEMYSRIGESLTKSPIRRSPEFMGTKGKTAIPKSRLSPSPEYSPVIKKIPVDESRTIEIRTKPGGSSENFEFAATKEDWEMPKDWEFDQSGRFPPPPPRKVKKDIASLSIKPDGYVNMVNSSYTGAKEGAVERLMMEASKRGMVPYSSIQLEPGKNMVGRFLEEYTDTPKEKYLQKISDFLSTGKTGKIWSHLPLIGTGIGAATALSYSDPALAALDSIVPGGLEELGSADERSIPDPRYQEYIRRMQSKGRK